MAHQPNLADLRRMLGINLFLDFEYNALMNTQQHGLVCNYLGLTLSSAFQPIVKADGQIVGREALLRAGYFEHGELQPQAAFEHAVAADKLVSFDRLVRTIHLLNHASVFDEHELLFLNVHPQLLVSVSNHGRTFEQILHYYSVPTSQVVIEIKDSADETVLADAVSNYRSLGYRIALENFGGEHSNLERTRKLKPDIVKLHGALIRAATQSHSAAESLKQLVANLHQARIQVAITGIETKEQLEIARKSGANLLQGYQLAKPEFADVSKKLLGRDEKLAA